MMKKSILVVSLTVIMMVFLGINLNAKTQDVDAFINTFNLDEKDIESKEVSDIYYEVAGFQYSDDAMLEKNTQYGNFVFSSGLGRLKMSAFATEKRLIGYGKEGSKIGLLIYRDSDQGKVMIDSNSRILGASGLYNEQINFANNQLQYLVVAVKEDDLVFSKVFEVVIKPKATKAKLENIELNFIKEENKALPNIDLPIRTSYVLD